MKLRRIDRISGVVPRTVGYICDEPVGMALGIAEDTVDGTDHDLDEVDIPPFVESADVVGLSDAAFMEDQIDRAGMVLDVKPVADILAGSIYRKRSPIAYIIDEQRDKFLRELVRSVIVRAVGHDGRKAVGVVEGADEMVRRSLRGAVWTVRIVFCLLSEQLAIKLQSAVDFIGADVVEPAWNGFRCTARIMHDVARRLPALLCSLKEGEGAHDICAGKCERILYRTVNMGLGGKVDDAIDMLLLHEGKDSIKIADVHTDKPVIRLILDIAKVRQIAGVRQFIDVNYLIIRIFIDKQPDNMGTDEPGTACYDYRTFHFTRFIRYWPYWFLIIGCANSRTRSAVIQPLT